MASRITKEALFKEFVSNTLDLLPLFEHTYSLDSGFLSKSIFGLEVTSELDPVSSMLVDDRLTRSAGWSVLSELHDYAYEGLVAQNFDHIEYLVLNAAEILGLLTCEHSSPSQMAFDVIATADGRFALDQGDSVELKKLALLANVDERTVRNAISSGDLASTKVMGSVFIPNQAALTWLKLRRGFKPSKFLKESLSDLDSVQTATEFGAYLRKTREQLGVDFSDGKVALINQAVQPADIITLESGIFCWPLNMCQAFADFYQIDRKAFLLKVMNIFFRDQLRVIEQSSGLQGEG